MALFLILVGVFTASLAYSFYYQLEPSTDALAYDRIAWNLACGFGYIELESNVENPLEDDAIIRVGPGYELFLAGIYRTFGHATPVVWILHAIFRVISTFFVYKTALALFKENRHRERIAFLSALLFGFSPDLVLINGMLMTETLLLLGLIVATYFSIRYVEEKKAMTAFWAGLSFGLTALVRPTVLLAAGIFFLALLARRSYRHAALFIIIPVIVVGGWSARNSLLYEKPLFTTTAGSYDLWVGNHPDATGGFDKTREIQEARDSMHSTKLSSLALKNYFRFLAEHPIQFTELQFRKTAIYFSLIRPTGFWSFLKDVPLEKALTLGASGAWTLILFVFGGSGAAYLFLTRHDTLARFFLVFALLQPLAVIPIIVETRYRYPLFPFLAVFGAFFMVKFFADASDRKTLRRIFWGTTLAFIAVTLYDVGLNSGELFSRVNEIIS